MALTPGQGTTIPHAAGQPKPVCHKQRAGMQQQRPSTDKEKKKKTANQVDRLKDSENKEMMARR